MKKKIFIIHGWTYTLTAWDACIGLLEKAGYEVVMLHVPGLTEPSDQVWSLDMYTAWLDQKLYHEKDVFLVGHSNGGRIAIAYNAEHPEKIKKLVLIDSAGIVHNNFVLQAKRKIFGSLAKVFKNIFFINNKNSIFRKVFYKIIRAHDYERAPENMRETMKLLISHDLTPMLSHIQTPTLIIWGKKDTATPVSDAHVMHTHIQHSKLIVIPDAGHSPHKTHPEYVAQEVVAWFE